VNRQSRALQSGPKLDKLLPSLSSRAALALQAACFSIAETTPHFIRDSDFGKRSVAIKKLNFNESFERTMNFSYSK
jgi:hypothetical protein